jgi:dipeptidyl-peptidase-4
MNASHGNSTPIGRLAFPGKLSRRRFVLLLLCATCLAPVPAALAQQTPRDLTVERIYGAPSLSGQILRDTRWSPDGKWLSYLTGNGDRTEIWVVDANTGERHTLVDAAHLRDVLLPPASRGQQTGLGRLTPSQYRWAPDSQALLFIGAQQLAWYDLKSQTSRHLLPAVPADSDAPTLDDAKISPDGRWVSFIRNHDLWVVSATGSQSAAAGQPRQLTRDGSEAMRNGELDWVYPEELDLTTAYWWSPDSSKIAFLQLDEGPVGKYPLVNELAYGGELTEEHYPIAGSSNPVARVGIVPVAGAGLSQVRWMDTGADKTVLLARVNWLKDSRRLAIQRLNRVQNQLELLFADSGTGRAQTVLAETDKSWINLADDLHFFADGQRFLWSSERSGFRHLYLYDLSGKQLVQLTHGDWEVDAVESVDEAGGQVYFTSTQASPIERHLYRVSLAGGEPVEVTPDRGSHGINLAPDARHFLDTYSTAMMPPRQDLCNADGSRVAALAENKVAELDTYRLSPVEFFTVPGADGTTLQVSLIKPRGFDPARKYPVLVYLYGGPHVQLVRDLWQGANFLWNEMMAEKGFIIFTVDNRGSAGRGHAFESAILHHFGEAELADQLAGVKWLKQQPYVDGNRIGVWGWSYGGYMTCLAMLRAGDTFKAGFAGAPVTDWRYYDTIYTERYMGLPKDNPNGYRDSSPVNYAAGLRGKLLIAHASGDDNVHFGNTLGLADKLVDAQKYAEFLIYARRGHGISDAPARIHVFNRVTQFFMENLAP